MNRPIKFRAWDKKREQFVPQGEIVFSFYGDTRVEVVPNDLSYSHDPIHDHPDPGRFVVEQFTGLTDRNGVEIYEGDVLKLRDETFGEVVWSESSTQFQATFLLVGRKVTYAGDLLSILEVIGNIHTHTELVGPNP